MSRQTRKTLKLAIVGAGGRMGRQILELVEAAKDLEIAARIETAKDWTVNPKDVDLVVDFSSPKGLRIALAWCLRHRKPLVSGTTGLGPRQRQELKAAAKKIAVLHSANMSLGIAVLSSMLESFRALRSWDFQIDEVHHKRKKDAPSGTAWLLDQRLSQAVEKSLPKPNSIRGGGIPGIHRVWAMGEDEVLVLEHTAFNRKVFAQGALVAARWLFDKKRPGLYDLSDLYKMRS